MRALALFVVAASTGCAALLGVDDPTPDFGGDGGPRALVSIAIGPDPLSLPLGASRQLSAVGTFDDDSTDDLTAQVEFAVDSGGSVTVTPDGLAKAVAEGPTTVSARLGKIRGDTVALVGPAAPERLMFSLGALSIAQQQAVRVRTIAILTDGSMADATATATYTTGNGAIAIAIPGQIAGGSTAGSTTITAALPGATPAMIQVTVGTKICRPVINELLTGSNASAAEEWVELYNPCTAPITVDGWTLVYRGAATIGATDTTLMIALAGQLQPGELRLYAGQDYAGTNDGKWPGATGLMGQNNGAVGLRAGPKDTGPLVDAVAYGAVSDQHPFIEGAPTPAMVNSRSAQRQPYDGRDGDDTAQDFQLLTTLTPRALNAP